MNSYQSIQSSQAPAAQSISRMDEALSEASGQLNGLTVTIETLRTRLSAALLPESLTGESTGSETKRPQSALLVDSVSDLADRVRRNNVQLQELLSRLAI